MKTLSDNSYQFLWIPFLLAAACLQTQAQTEGITLGLVGSWDDDPGVAFSSADFFVNESDGEVTVTVLRGNDGDFSFTVDYSVSEATATAGQDFTAVSGTLSFARGEQTKTFAVPILNDPLLEPEETIRLALSNPTGGAVLGNAAAATIHIADNDAPKEFRLALGGSWPGYVRAPAAAVAMSGATPTWPVEGSYR